MLNVTTERLERANYYFYCCFTEYKYSNIYILWLFSQFKVILKGQNMREILLTISEWRHRLYNGRLL